jgi:hypothetical protein
MLFREIIAACCKTLEHYEYTLGRMLNFLKLKPVVHKLTLGLKIVPDQESHRVFSASYKNGYVLKSRNRMSW